MNETVTKRFLLYFRLMLLVWILIANAVIHLTGMEYSWLIFLSNIMMFTLEGDVKDRLVTVELGGLVGLVLSGAAFLVWGENLLSHPIFVFLHKMFCGQGFPLDKRANVSYYI